MTRTFQFHGDQVLTDAVVGAGIASDAPLGIGVRHGWHRVGEPMLVTRSEGNRVHALDDRPALDVYLEQFGTVEPARSNEGAFMRRAITHPLVPERRWQASIPTGRSPARGGCAASTTRPWSSCRSPEMPPPVWSTQQLAEFLAAVSSSETEASAALAAVERAAEALDAEVAAILCDGEVVAAVGYSEGAAPVADLCSVAPG